MNLQYFVRSIQQKFKILNSLQIGYRMSVSLSSVYQQTESLRQIEQKFDLAIKQQEKFDPIIQDIVNQVSNLSMSESYRLLVLLSKNLTNSSSVARKYGGLYTIKKLILTAYHHFYIFASIRVIPWISNIAKFQIKKSEFQRAKLYIKQMSLKGNGDQVYQERQCYKLFKLADQFLPWFSQNIPVHINAQFEYKSTFARAYDQIQPKKQIKSFEHFQQRESNKFELSFNSRRGHNRELIKQLTDFVGLEVRSLIDQQKYKSELLKEIVKTSDSYCIKAIVSELSTMIEDSKKLVYCLKLTDHLMNVGQVQFIQLTKLYILPPLLGYILPYNFSQNKKLVKPQFACSPTDEKFIIDYISIWSKITEKVGLSTKFYHLVLQQIQSSKGNLPIVQEKHLGEFLTSVIDMQSVNNDKRPHIINLGVEQQLMKVLSSKSGGIKLTNQWKKEASVINELSQFKESQISNFSKNSSSSGSIGFGKLLNIQQKTNLGNSQGITSNKVIVPHPQLLTFKDVNQSNQMDAVNKSPFKDSIKLINQKQQSFMDFNASQISKYSQYSIQKVNQPKQKSIQQVLLMQPNQPSTHSKKSIKSISGSGSESGSVVYFSHSQDFHSQNRDKSESNPSFYKRSNRPSVAEVKSQKSLKFHNINQQSVSTYRFDSSNISKNSFSNSDIKNYGKLGQQFPATIPKPGFGFKRRQMNLVDPNSNGQIVTYQNVLGSQISNKKDNSLSKIIEKNYNSKQLRESFQSGIEDLSGGRHNFNGSVRLSEGGESAYKQQSSRCRQQRKTYKESRGLRPPQNEYFQNIKLQNQNGRNTKQIKGKKTQQNILRESPKKPKMSFSSDQKLPKDQLQKLSAKEQNSDSYNISSNLKNTFLIKNGNGKSIEKATKQTVIIDEYANDRLLDLQRQLGRALLQKNMKQQQLKKKQAQCKILKSKSVPFNNRKMEVLKKQDEIMEILQNQKQGQDISSKNFEIIKPVKNKNNITDLFLQNESKGSYFPTNLPYQRTFVKQILASRCLLIKNENLQLGFNYSQSQDQIGLYLTVYKAFDTIDLQVKPNSLKLQKQVNLSLQNQVAGYQVKIKRKVKGLNQQNKQTTFKQIINRNPTQSFRYPEVCINLLNQLGQSFDYKVPIPCSLLNLVKQIQIDKEIIEQLKYQKVFKADPMPINQQFIKNHKQKIDKYFPHNLALIGGWYLIGYRFPNHIFGKQEDQFLKFKVLNSRFIEFQFFNSPKNPLSQTILSLMTGNTK